MGNIRIPRTSDIEKEFVELKDGKVKEKSLTYLFKKIVDGDFIEAVPPSDCWIEANFNMGNLLSQRKHLLGESEGYIHPLQEIDILFGPMTDGIKKTPITAVEAKLFRNTGTPKSGIPKAFGEGFHAGIGQAIGLLVQGVDFVELWHFFLLLPEEGGLREERFIRGAGSYSVYIDRLIKILKLPIGYWYFTVTLNEDWMEVECDEKYYIRPKENPFLNAPDGLKIRSLIKDKLNINEE
uniref:Uncharacterized protein n=1 Tax=uncultured Methanosarcinales archaeon TaxID=183757 RepID=A0A7H1KNX2_9EURY|nr:hypothetical protein BFFPPMPJ_00041 [uncultured Methanosarcinales archaeon]